MKSRRFFRVGFAPESRIGNAVEVDSIDLGDFSHTDVAEGLRLGALPPNVVCRINHESTVTLESNVLVNGYGWKIVDAAIRDCFSRLAGNDVEILPIAVHDRNDKPVAKKFFVINLLKVLEGILSEEHSTYLPGYGDGEKTVMKLAIRGATAPADLHALPQGQDEYHYQGPDKNGNLVNGPSDLMGAGSNLQPFYYQNWADEVNSSMHSVGCRSCSCSYKVYRKGAD